MDALPKNRYHFVLLSLFFLAGTFFPVAAFSRDAPVTTAGSAISCPGGSISVPVTVTNFVNVTAISLRLEYDSTLMVYCSHTVNSELSGLFLNVVKVGGTSNLYKVLVVWSNVIPKNLADGSALFTLNFTYLAGNDSIRFNNTVGGGGACEYADENGQAMNDLPSSLFYHHGSIVNAGPAAAGTISGPNQVCSGLTGLTYTVDPITNATGYVWTIPPGAIIVQGENTNQITVDFPAGAQSGDFSVYGTNLCGSGMASPPYPVAVNPLPAAGLSGTASLCAGTSSPLMVELTGSPPWSIVYTDGTDLFPIENIASPQYLFWVTPVQTTSYWITAVSDGNGCSGSASGTVTLTVNPSPTATITGSQTICAGNSAPLSVGLTGTPPWEIIYSDGIHQYSVPGITATPFTFDVAPAETTTYAVISVTDGHLCLNSGAGSATITVHPIPEVPVVTLDGMTLNSSAPSGNQWYYEGTGLLPGATGQTYTVTNNTGYYWCVVTLDGCSSEASNQVWVDVVGMEDQEQETFRVFPVPGNGLFRIAMKDITEAKLSLKVFTSSGSLAIHHENLPVDQGTFFEQVDIRHLSDGIYTLVITSGDSVFTRRLIKIR
ncbi:MAG TPA: T9SS type A sorting domain-containing protein [Bacteroidales bacterium]|nr:T9SS type A sorting domain-containing protein [Bacteroidales bacterium]HPT09149.1 T9SS type A sorting domain-containing protein [Bacteroidales bacterium]